MESASQGWRHYVWILCFCVCATVIGFVLPKAVNAWDANADRLITNQAVYTLPDEIRPFFEANRQYLVQHVTDPVDDIARDPTSKAFHFIELDHYGAFPYSTLPRDYKSAVSKFGRATVATHGQLPWQIGLYSAHLTDAFKSKNWDVVRANAAYVAYYVAEAHDPFNTTMNNDGHLTGQLHVNLRFGTSLFDRYSLFFFTHPAPAAYISDPTQHAFDICLTAHSWLEQILLADTRALEGLPDHTDEYYDRFYNQAGTILVRQITDSATDVGSYWLTSWTNAGKPSLPNH